MVHVPDGYRLLTLYQHGSNVLYVTVLVCKKCGALVGATYQHNAWHDEQGPGIDEDVLKGNEEALKKEMSQPPIRRTDA